MPKRKAVSGSGILNVITKATNGVANTTLPFVDSATFSNFAKELAGAPDMYQNAFLDNLANLGFLQKFIQMRGYESYFRRLYGEDILAEQLVNYAVDAIKARGYDPEDTQRFLESHPPRVGSQIMQKVLRRQYQVSTIEDLITAISGGEAAFMSMYDACTTQLWNSYEDDNLQTIKELINENLEEGNLRLFPLAKPDNQDKVLALMTEVDTVANDWNAERSRQYDLAGFKTHTPSSDLMYLFNNRIAAINKNYNLAWAFNENYLDLQKEGKAITMASSALAGGNVYSAIFDRELFEIHNRVGHPKITSFYNPGTLEMERLLTCFTLYGMSLYHNSLWFIDPSAVGIDSATLDTRSGSKAANPGDIVEIYVDSVTATTGKYADKFGTFSLQPETVTSQDTYIDPDSGELFIGKDETGADVGAGDNNKYIRAYWYSHLDANVYAEILIKINQ